MSDFKKEWMLLTVREHPTNENEQIAIFKIDNNISFDVSVVENLLSREEFTKICRLIENAPKMLDMLKEMNDNLIWCLNKLQKDGNTNEVDFQLSHECNELIKQINEE